MFEQHASVAEMPKRLQVEFVFTAKSRIKAALADAHSSQKFSHRCALVTLPPKYFHGAGDGLSGIEFACSHKFCIGLSVPFGTE